MNRKRRVLTSPFHNPEKYGTIPDLLITPRMFQKIKSTTFESCFALVEISVTGMFDKN
jgi:hypothetical protein